MAAIGYPPSSQQRIMDGDEVHLRAICISQLDMISRLSQTIVAKDKQIRALREKNSMLLKQLADLNSDVHVDNEIEIAPTSEDISELPDRANLPSEEKLVQNRRTKRGTKDKAVSAGVNLSPVNKAVQVAVDDTEVIESDRDNVLFTPNPYFTLQGEDFIQEEKAHVAEIMSQAEVPGWRELSLSPKYTMEGTENIEDETFMKRHDKLEFDEKRRKKWDIQRMREQRNLEKLRARYEETNGTANQNGIAKNTPVLGCLSNQQNLNLQRSLLPLPEQATHIYVSDEVPVSAFGFPVPLLPDEGFQLPWMH